MEKKRVLAIDYGASSGRAMLGEFDGQKIVLREVHRFSNDPVVINCTMYWDVLRLYHEMKQGMIRANLEGGFETVGIDTWGVDFGLIDESGNLLDNPVHYRDNRTAGLMEKSFAHVDREELYGITGIQFMEINTIFQLMAVKRCRPELLEGAECMLLMPDLLSYFLTGRKQAEYSIASTTQMMEAGRGIWSDYLLEQLGLPKRILPEIVPTGTIIGQIQESVCRELELQGQPEVIAVAGHDTQCAMASVPAREKDFIFISCGTWSLLGTELDAPVLNAHSFALNMTNEGGYQNKTSFLKNITGLWLVQESRRQWQREGKDYSFGALENMAHEAPGLQCFIDTDAPVFAAAGNIPQRIRQYCRETGQHVPQNTGEIIRCINESLAMKYAYTRKEIEQCTGKEYQHVHMVGGGIQSQMLCQMTADACGCLVLAGPVEATVYGNMVLQLLASGTVNDMQEARRIVAASEKIKEYEPYGHKQWEQAYSRYLKVIQTS